MAQQATLQARTRTSTGKGAARAMRRAGAVPAIIYGHAREPEALSIEAPGLLKLLTGLTAASSTILEVAVEGRAPVKALIREIQRDPLRPTTVLHLDLYEVRADEKITVEVPLRLEGVPDGVRNFGGILEQVMYRIEIRVFPGDIPERVDLDVTNLTIGHSMFVRDLNIPKAEILDSPDLPVCSVVAPRAEEVVAPAAEAVAPAEPELIRKPKAEGEGEEEAAKE